MIDGPSMFDWNVFDWAVLGWSSGQKAVVPASPEKR